MTSQDRAFAPPRGRSADVCVVMNLAAGRREGAATIAALRRGFARRPGRFALRVASSGTRVEAEARAAVAQGFGVVAAAGGDGTVAAVAAALAGTDVPLGVIPLGTFNYFARSVGAPEDLDEALAVIAGGSSVRVDVGCVNGRPFLNNASLGLYPSILRAREGVYARWGRSRIAAHGSLLMALLGFRDRLALKVTVDGAVRRVRTPLVFVAKNPRQLEEVGVPGAEALRRGRFALFIAPDVGRAALLRYAARLALRRMTPGRDFELAYGADILVDTARRRMTVACDGERTVMTAPFHFTLRRNALRVLAPAPGDAAP